MVTYIVLIVIVAFGPALTKPRGCIVIDARAQVRAVLYDELGREAAVLYDNDTEAAVRELSAYKFPQSLEHRVPKSTKTELDIIDVKSSLRSVMWRNVGIERTAQPDVAVPFLLRHVIRGRRGQRDRERQPSRFLQELRTGSRDAAPTRAD